MNSSLSSRDFGAFAVREQACGASFLDLGFRTDNEKMDATIERECSALGGLFQQIVTDMKVRNAFVVLLDSPEYSLYLTSLILSLISSLVLLIYTVPEISFLYMVPNSVLYLFRYF